MKATQTRTEELTAEWDTWATEECQAEFAEMTDELARLKNRIAADRESTTPREDPSWYGRAERARRHLAVERDLLALYLSKRRAKERQDAHHRRELTRPWENRFVAMARKELPAEWFEYLRQLTDQEIDKAAAQLAAGQEQPA